MEELSESAGDGSGGGRGVEIIENVELAGDAVLLAPSLTAVTLDIGVAGAGEGSAVDNFVAVAAVVAAAVFDLAIVVSKPPFAKPLVLVLAALAAGTIDWFLLSVSRNLSKQFCCSNISW